MLSLLSLLALAPPAHAFDFKEYAGSFSQPASSSTPTSLFYSKRLVNSTSTSTLDCPVALDTYSGGGPVASAAVYAVDNSTTASVSCGLVRVQAYSNSVWFSAVVSSGAASTDSVGGLLSISGLSAVGGMNYVFLSCSIPGSTSSGASGVATYWASQS